MNKKKDDKAELLRKAELERKIRKRVAAEEKAYRIVERLVDETVNSEFLVDAGQFITPSHFEDIVVERAIAKVCGYPVCPNTLHNVTKQKYHISTRSNKVYDITERKNFCSNQCYKSAKYFEKQISTTPLWAREDEARVHFELLPLDHKSGFQGAEVIGGKSEIKSELKHLQKLDKYEEKRKNKTEKKNQNETESSDVLEKLDSLHISDKPKNTSTDIAVLDDSDNSKHSEMLSNEVKVTGDEVKVTCEKVDKNACNSEETISDIDKEDTSGDFDKSQNQTVCTSQDSSCDTNEDKLNQEKNSDSQAKLEYLMKLLDRKKYLLGQMAQIETIQATSADNGGAKGDNSVSRQTVYEKDVQNPSVSVRETAEESLRLKNLDSEKFGLENFGTSNISVVPGASDELGNVLVNQEASFQNMEKSGIPKDTTKMTGVKNVRDISPTANVTENQPEKKLNTVGMICMSMKSWITVQTLKYLNVLSDHDVSEGTNATSDLQSKYEELEKRLGIDELVGDATAMGAGDVPQNRVPDYEALKEETSGFNIKVKEYYKGSFTFKTENKKDEVDVPVYLPTIDSHNQMLIRRKIVMERFDKSMPHILPPLKLSIQDVFSELRQLVATFSLDNKNILFKPIEWTVVSLIILKLLSRRNQKIATAFEQASGKNYLSIVLKGIGENVESFDNNVSNMLN